LCCPNDYTCQPDGLSCELNPDLRMQHQLISNSINENVKLKVNPIKILKTQLKTRKQSSSKLPQFFIEDLEAIACIDGVHYCPLKTTCCMINDAFMDTNEMSSFGCCAVENAVCCDDGVNCCPRGYRCSNGGDTVCIPN
jgi:hypothetical protein